MARIGLGEGVVGNGAMRSLGMERLARMATDWGSRVRETDQDRFTTGFANSGGIFASHTYGYQGHTGRSLCSINIK